MYKPLADEIRPKNLDDVVGQQHILAPGGMLRRLDEAGRVPNMIVASTYLFAAAAARSAQISSQLFWLST